MSILRNNLKILVPEYGAGGDHPTEGFFMKGLGFPDPDFFQDLTEDIPHNLDAFYSYIDDYSLPEYKGSTREPLSSLD
jgi:hypothetical protein